MKNVDIDYFSFLCAKETNECHYIYERQINSIIDCVKKKYGIAVKDVTDNVLEAYVAKMISRMFMYKREFMALKESL